MRGDPETVGRYAIVERIARGGMGVVYRARLAGEGGFSRDFALKRLHDHLAEDRESTRMLLDEARLAGLVRHPNVVSTIDVGRAGEHLYLVMDLVEGVSASELLARGERCPPAVALRIVLDVLDGLGAAHAAVDESGAPLEIVHRDVSPANILVGRDGMAKLTDFGIARARERLRTTVGAEVKGKLGYMPPEQLEGLPVDRRADLFASAVVLWELLTGQTLLHAQRSRLGEIPLRPEWFATGAGDAVDGVIAKALAVAPADRFPDAAAMQRALLGTGSPVAERGEVGALVGRIAPPRPMASARSVPAASGTPALPWRAEGPTADVVADVAWAKAPASAPASDVGRTNALPAATPRRRGGLVAGVLLGALVVVGLAAGLLLRERAVPKAALAAPPPAEASTSPSAPSSAVPESEPAAELSPATTVPAGTSGPKRPPHHAKRPRPGPRASSDPTDAFGGRH